MTSSLNTRSASPAAAEKSESVIPRSGDGKAEPAPSANLAFGSLRHDGVEYLHRGRVVGADPKDGTTAGNPWVNGFRPQVAGSHLVLPARGRVPDRAPDGYRAQRSYSIALAPRPGLITLTVERPEDGEVSPYLVDEMTPGALAEIRGPIGELFVWSAADRHPPLLIAGGFGLVPLISMLRQRSALSAQRSVGRGQPG